MAAQDGAGEGDSENIPVLSSISPSIFVPTDRDFTKTPPPLSDDPVTRLEATMEALDWHAARVEENMVAMLVREAQRVRRGGYIERVQYDSYHRPIKDYAGYKRAEKELLLEERMVREDTEAFLKTITGKKSRDEDDKQDPHDRRPHPRQPSASSILPPLSETLEPEYTDLATLRREKLLRLEVDEVRQTPRAAALTHVLNLVKWGWEDQLEGHRDAVRKEKESRRADLHRRMKENPFPLATSGPAVPASPIPRAGTPQMQAIGDDLMDVD
ncbi:hypothetical protein F4861DRAFT_50582 [Xylaria intraflava]|nr:hypothetical protein F4861DRAFT_50582 [Xylaria intraflava]